MSSGPIRTGPPSKPGPGSFASVPPNTQSLLLDKLNARTSTPDSEALASSDDELDIRYPDHQQSATLQRTGRRPSWLIETASIIPNPRKGSFASNSMSPTTSHPSTPSAETGAGPWGAAPGATIGRTNTTSSFASWHQGIWNTDRKDAPSRLAEVLPSPTSTLPPGASGGSFFGPDSGLPQPSPASRDSAGNIPFAIPLHPTPKTYRSQSYSVGQLEQDQGSVPSSMSSSAMMGRSRGHPHSGLQHRPSRPSMLSEMSNEGGLLGKVKEVDDDDDESTTESLQSSQHLSQESKTIERLTRENAMLRQQQYQNNRIRPRASTQASYGAAGNGYNVRGSVPEESEYAIDELDEASESGDLLARRAVQRRLSEFGPSAVRSPFSLENRQVETLKKAAWQTTPFGGQGVADVSSRRHSFADVPVRQASISSIGETVANLEASSGEPHAQDYSAGYPDNPAYGSGHPVSYFAPGGLAPQSPSAYANPYPSPYGLHSSFPNRAPSPHRNVYSMAQPRQNQLLHIVLFKCARADVFYIQEGTGLNVKAGDLVIVEADRGTDLGTVAQSDVDWQQAKEIKEHYAEEHYKWLMMYSQNANASSPEGPGGSLVAPNGLQGSAIGGMGPPNQHAIQEPNAGELKPKLIKRLAQNHEIHTLREKEGNEAKAKRICTQKVKEHGLNMEILDAEYQMDWKKLTFYYFADSYINFNSLVTDLFKIYKTRIWMSAINPASFASPGTLGIQAPSGVGIGAVGVGRGATGSERRQGQQQPDPAPANYAAATPTGRGYQQPPSFAQAYGNERPGPNGAYPPGGPTGSAYSQYGGFSSASRGSNGPFAQNSGSNSEGFPAGFDYPSRSRFPNASAAPGAGGLQQNDQWIGNFQGLSLNSR